LEVCSYHSFLLWLCHWNKNFVQKVASHISINNVLNEAMCKVIIVLQFSKQQGNKFLNLEWFLSFEINLKFTKFGFCNQSIPLHCICPSLCLFTSHGEVLIDHFICLFILFYLHINCVFETLKRFLKRCIPLSLKDDSWDNNFKFRHELKELLNLEQFCPKKSIK